MSEEAPAPRLGLTRPRPLPGATPARRPSQVPGARLLWRQRGPGGVSTSEDYLPLGYVGDEDRDVVMYVRSALASFWRG